MSCLFYVNIIDSFERFFELGKFYGVFKFVYMGIVIFFFIMLEFYKDFVFFRVDNFVL